MLAPSHLIACGAFVVALPASALAHEPAILTAGSTIITIGGGVQLLSLPDINFTFLVKGGDAAVRTLKNSDFSEYGGVLVGAVETPLGYWGNTPVTAVVSGFFANVEDTDRTHCKSTSRLACFAENIVDRPGRGDSFGFGKLTTTAYRDADYWGASAEARFGKAPAPLPDRGGYLFRLAYVGIGADVRGIDQDNRLQLRGDGVPINYSETLDTTYSGAFLSAGGEYNLLGYLGVGRSWGIRSLLSLRGGLYNASTGYDGRFSARGTTTRLGLSNDELAFIGGASFETRKQFGRRTSLSLVTDYEWYSFAPKMKYVNADRGGCVEDGSRFDCPGTVSRTHISSDNAFEVRTALRLNVALGSAALYEEPIK